MLTEGAPDQIRPDAVLPDLLAEAVGSFDADALASLLAPGCRHWLNISGRELGRDEVLAQLTHEASFVARATYEVQASVPTGRGFVLQLTIRGETRGGVGFEIPACLVVEVEGGLVTRIDEYASAHHAAPIVREMSGHQR